MNEYLRLVLAVFTCYRLARLIAIDDGPYFVFKRLRYWFKDKAYHEAGGTIKAMEDDRNFGKWKNLSEGISCPFCIGIYASVLVFPMLVWPSYYGDLFLLLVSLSGMQAFLQTLDRRWIKEIDMPEMSENLSELKETMEKAIRENTVLRQGREGVLISLESSLRMLKRNRPNDRSEVDRRYAIAITDFEKTMAYFKTYILDEYMLSGVSQSSNE